MSRTPIRSATLMVAAVLLTSACSTTSNHQVLSRAAFRPVATAGPTDTSALALIENRPQVAPSTTTIPESSAASTPAPATSNIETSDTTAAPSPPPPTAPPRPRVVIEQAWTPFAAVEGVTLVHPSSRVERVGFHQSNHEGARQLEPLPSAAAPVTMDARERLAASRTAADVVIDPAVEVRAPVTGTVKRAGTYVLYCEYSDDFVVIEPDARPGWEVKVLHIDGVRVGTGDRVVSGETVIAGGPTPLPFESQVDELTAAATAWPHVHIEVIDLAIPNIPSPGGGCD